MFNSHTELHRLSNWLTFKSKVQHVASRRVVEHHAIDVHTRPKTASTHSCTWSYAWFRYPSVWQDGPSWKWRFCDGLVLVLIKLTEVIYWSMLVVWNTVPTSEIVTFVKPLPKSLASRSSTDDHDPWPADTLHRQKFESFEPALYKQWVKLWARVPCVPCGVWKKYFVKSNEENL